MKCYYDKQDYDNAVIYADKVLANAKKTDDNVKSDAQIITALCYENRRRSKSKNSLH
jgi:hypothetical protein